MIFAGLICIVIAIAFLFIVYIYVNPSNPYENAHQATGTISQIVCDGDGYYRFYMTFTAYDNATYEGQTQPFKNLRNKYHVGDMLTFHYILVEPKGFVRMLRAPQKIAQIKLHQNDLQYPKGGFPYIFCGLGILMGIVGICLLIGSIIGL